MTTKNRKYIYELLKRKGHSPQKAASIILDATRELRHGRPDWAVSWIRIMFSQRRNANV